MREFFSNPSALINMTCVIGLFTRWLMAPADRKRTEYVLSAFIFATLAVQGSLPLMDHVTLVRPLKYDLYILRFDELLGDPGFLVAQLVRKSLLLTWVVLVTYGVLHLAILVAFTATLYLRPQDTWLLVRTFVANMVLAVLVYLAIPVCGPVYAFANFPNIPHIAVAHPIPLTAACNGVPSVHMSTALLVFWLLRRWHYGRVFGVTFAVLTVLATLATGEHYVFDLLCAVPYAAAIYGFAKLWPQRSASRSPMLSAQRQPQISFHSAPVATQNVSMYVSAEFKAGESVLTESAIAP